jgi:hypothetical protein
MLMCTWDSMDGTALVYRGLFEGLLERVLECCMSSIKTSL